MDDNALMVLTGIENVIENILTNLPIVELLGKRRVCSVWKDVIDKIVAKQSRKTYVTCNVIETNGAQASKCERTDGEFYSTFQNKYGRLVKRVKYECDHFAPEHRQLVDQFLKWRSTWTHFPRIIFITHRISKMTDKECVQNFRHLNELIVRYIPPNCVLLMLKGAMYRPGSELNTCLRNESLFFSSVPTSTVDVLCWQSMGTAKERMGLAEALKTFLIAQNELKAVIFYYRLSSQHVVSRWIRSMVCPLMETYALRHNSAVVLGCATEGSIQHSQLCSNTFVKLSQATLSGKKFSGSLRNIQKCGAFMAIAISGKSVFSSSVLLDHNVNSISELTLKLQQLKKSIPSHIELKPNQTNAFGFMVSCLGRVHDFEWYNDYNGPDQGSVERKAFERAIPNVPLMVTHGFGEVGGDMNLEQKPYTPISLMHYHSTIFAVIVL